MKSMDLNVCIFFLLTDVKPACTVPLGWASTAAVMRLRGPLIRLWLWVLILITAEGSNHRLSWPSSLIPGVPLLKTPRNNVIRDVSSLRVGLLRGNPLLLWRTAGPASWRWCARGKVHRTGVERRIGTFGWPMGRGSCKGVSSVGCTVSATRLS